MFANSQGGGTDMAFPDVCRTPAASGVSVPTPYANTALGSRATGAATTVFFGGTPAHNLSSSVSMTDGDEAGVYRGTTSGSVMGSSRHLTGANTVLVGGSPVSRLSSTTLQNSTNCSGARLSPSQTVVLVLAS